MLNSGDVLVVERPFTAFSGKKYEKGMELKLIEPTGKNPFGYMSGLCNWTVDCPFFRPPADQSVWSCIWFLMDIGTVKKK